MLKVWAVGDGTGLGWWGGTTWRPFGQESLGSTGCISATVDASASPSLMDLTGTVTGAFGTASSYGSTATMPLDAPVVGIAASPTGGGHWLASTDGGVFSFGDAPFEGSLQGQGST